MKDCYEEKMKEIGDALNKIHNHYFSYAGLRPKTNLELAATFEPRNGCKECEEAHKWTQE